MVIAVDFGRVAAAPNPLVKNWSSILQVLGASLLIALCAQIKVTLPFTPVPITMQTLAILLVGATLGSRKGALAVLAYFSEILMGLPVLANASIDPLIFVGPKAGYVLGFLVQAYSMGWMVERMKSFSMPLVFLAGLVACTLEMSLGVLGLAPYVGWSNILWMGVYPFLVGEIVKVCAMCYILKRSLMSGQKA